MCFKDIKEKPTDATGKVPFWLEIFWLWYKPIGEARR